MEVSGRSGTEGRCRGRTDQMKVFEALIEKKTKLAVVGLGYVGLPAALSFARKLDVIGFDTDSRKIGMLCEGKDPTGEAQEDAIRAASICFTNDERLLREASFIIIAVPTPVLQDHTPDLACVREASHIVGRNLKRGTIVVYESTVYPGVTQEICIPILERESGLKCPEDFAAGYSPERVNPGDKLHRFENITKIVSGITTQVCEEIRAVYDLVVEAGTYPVRDMKTAEAVKIVENSQRDINIAFMNEMAMVFQRMGIDTNEVIDGMNTKWNALGFRPGLVGGHCIGVDPYYFTYEAERLGFHNRMITGSRIVNDRMGAYIAEEAIRKMAEAGLTPRESRVVILGFTFKENCNDIRNTKVADIVNRLKDFGVTAVVTDPGADVEQAKRLYGITLTPVSQLPPADCVIIAVAHEEYRRLGLQGVEGLFSGSTKTAKVLLDVKGIVPLDDLRESGIIWWRL